MKSLKNPLITAAMAFALAIPVLAQQSNTSNQQEQGMQGMQSEQMQHGSMDQMMQKCRSTMLPMMNRNSQARKDIASAKASNDPAKMRSALDEAEKAIDGMDAHMNSCMSMMNMMQNMHGMMGGEQNSGEQNSPETQSPPKQ